MLGEPSRNCATTRPLAHCAGLLPATATHAFYVAAAPGLPEPTYLPYHLDLTHQLNARAMTVKRSHVPKLGAPSAKKRIRSQDNFVVWPCDSRDLCLDLDLSLPAEHFLKEVGVCRGIHAAADDSMSGRYGVANRMASYKSWQGLSEQSWRCCAELNVLLNVCKHRLGELTLVSSHSWTRAAKAITYAKAQQHYEQLSQPQAQAQLLMVAHIMDSVLHGQHDIAICRYTFNLQHACPGWLRSWCEQWSFTSGVLYVLRIEAFSSSTPKLAGFDLLGYPVHVSEPSQTADRTVYVPCIC